MGEVYLAEDTKLNRKVAIKILPPDTTASEPANRRLLREARAAANLDHPNICAIHEVGEDDGRSFIHVPPLEFLIPTLNGWLDETLGSVKRE